MPSRRFWMMERQIDRIRAEQEIRSVQMKGLINPPQSTDQARRIEEFIGRLTLEIGETARIRRNIYVAPEQGAKEKFLKLIGN